ncbi:putative ABC transport system ATP-binding protein/lipoprotein-releasing system ATP-binding protein [Actinomyces ruminicola]|uniref:Putative ABC transport system ATP-binding protein/lipoprotein-releasing system ATP-binding protein n=1 Tax=Actinomyces ruminicola TaxID=332524 RepID=A0A1H0D4Z0_9ACTO|nr:ABC transporter ATP-binding protein [Actinomyces ruminicola]SDN64951.1 putative ABC transport system ATP-binding protein/lipoprotein-releasing system ATP-binding protein [Actinomyces ruminicola]
MTAQPSSVIPQPGTEPVLAVQGLTVSFGERTVLDALDLTLQASSTTALIGPSGSGKSTLLSAILGLLRADAGSITICGEAMQAGNSASTARIRREHIGMVFQDGYLIDELTPVENIIVPALVAGVPATDAEERAHAILAELGLTVQERATSSFSGGERQRIAIARALINSPQLLIADEPTGSLDPANRDRVMDTLVSLPQQLGCAILLVTHDPVVAQRADHVMALADGKLTATVHQSGQAAGR